MNRRLERWPIVLNKYILLAKNSDWGNKLADNLLSPKVLFYIK